MARCGCERRGKIYTDRLGDSLSFLSRASDLTLGHAHAILEVTLYQHIEATGRGTREMM